MNVFLLLFVACASAQWPSFYENEVPGTQVTRYEMGSGGPLTRCSAYLPTGPDIPQSLPVVSFIPGYFSSLTQYYDRQMRALSSHGFIVVGKNSGPRDYDQTPETTVEYCLRMAYADSVVQIRMDTDRVGLSCNSHGCGMTVNAAGRSDLQFSPNGPSIIPLATATSSGWQQNADKNTNRNRDSPWPDYNTLGTLQGEFMMMCGTRDDVAPCAIYGRDVVQALNGTGVNLIDMINTDHGVSFYTAPITAFFMAKLQNDDTAQRVLDNDLPQDMRYQDITTSDLNSLAEQEAQSCYYCPPCETSQQNPLCTKWPPEY